MAPPSGPTAPLAHAEELLYIAGKPAKWKALPAWALGRRPPWRFHAAGLPSAGRGPDFIFPGWGWQGFLALPTRGGGAGWCDRKNFVDFCHLDFCSSSPPPPDRRSGGGVGRSTEGRPPTVGRRRWSVDRRSTTTWWWWWWCGGVMVPKGPTQLSGQVLVNKSSEQVRV